MASISSVILFLDVSTIGISLVTTLIFWRGTKVAGSGEELTAKSGKLLGAGRGAGAGASSNDA